MKTREMRAGLGSGGEIVSFGWTYGVDAEDGRQER